MCNLDRNAAGGTMWTHSPAAQVRRKAPQATISSVRYRRVTLPCWQPPLWSVHRHVKVEFPARMNLLWSPPLGGGAAAADRQSSDGVWLFVLIAVAVSIPVAGYLGQL